jgi:SAM-dependent methyltransferase
MTDSATSPDRTTAEALARLYDLDLAEDPGDLDLYRALARRTGGPILELGVGTGRLAVPLASDGYAVTGVDRDPAMLARARVRASAAGLVRAGSGPDARTGSGAGRPSPARDGRPGQLKLVEADVVGLSLASAGSFRLAFIALSSLLLLASRAAQQAAFGVLARHLTPGGVAAVDVWLPAPDDLVRYDGRLGLEHVRVEPDTGRMVTRVSSARHDPATQLVTLTTIYEEAAQGEPPTRWLRTDRLRLVSADELAAFAEEAGLLVEQVAGGYDLEPIGPGSERAVLLAVRP